MKKIRLPWRCLASYKDVVCIENRKWTKIGRKMTVCGLIMTAVGYYLTVDSAWRFTDPADYDMAVECTEETLGYLI